MEQKLEGMTLANVAEGKLEEQFQDALAAAIDVFDNAGLYETTKDGDTKVKINLEVELERQPEQSMVQVAARADVKRPKRLKVARHAWMKLGTFLVDRAQQQRLDLPEPRPRRPHEER